MKIYPEFRGIDLKFSTVVFILSLGISGQIQARDIAITIEDTPRPSTSMLEGEERQRQMLMNLKKVKAPPLVFFAHSSSFESMPKAKERLRIYARSGNFIASTGHESLDPSKVELEVFKTDIKIGQTNMSRMNKFVRFYRYPEMSEKLTDDKSDAIKKYLKKLKMKEGYFTVKAGDDVLDAKVQKAMDDLLPIDMENLKKIYIDMVKEEIDAADKLLSVEEKAKTDHVLSLHENDLTALYIGHLIEALKADGWNVVSAPKIYRKQELSDKNMKKLKLRVPSCDEAVLQKRLKAAKVF